MNRLLQIFHVPCSLQEVRNDIERPWHWNVDEAQALASKAAKVDYFLFDFMSIPNIIISF